MQIPHGTHGMQHLVLMALLSGQRGLWMLDIALADGIKSMKYWRKKIGRTCENDVFQLCVGTYCTYNRVEAIEHDQDTSAGIRHLVLHLALGIQGVGRYNHGACS